MYIFIKKGNIECRKPILELLNRLYKINISYLGELFYIENSIGSKLIEIKQHNNLAVVIHITQVGKMFDWFDQCPALKEYGGIELEFYSEKSYKGELFEGAKSAGVDALINTSGYMDGFKEAYFSSFQCYIDTYLFMAYNAWRERIDNKKEFKVCSLNKLIQLIRRTLPQAAPKFNLKYKLGENGKTFTLETAKPYLEIQNKDSYNRVCQEFGSLEYYIILKAMKEGIVEKYEIKKNAK